MIISFILLALTTGNGCLKTDFNKNEYTIHKTNGECFNVSIILVPGLGGSQLIYRTKKPNLDNKFSSIFDSLWIDPIKLVLDHYRNYLKPIYNPINNTLHDYDGIDIDVESKNSTHSVEFLTPTYEYPLEYWSHYYYYVSKELTLNHCFKRDYDLFAMPYDFRMITYKPKLIEFIDRMTNLVENIYRKTNKKIVFMSHSLGGPLTNIFLNRKSLLWKNKYIQGWMSINGVFGPDIAALSVMAIGNNPFLSYVIPKEVIRHIASTMPSLYSIMPNLKNSPYDQVIAIVDDQDYTVGDIYRIFNLTNIPYGKELSLLAEPIFECIKEDIFMHFVYSNGFPTKKNLVLKKHSDNIYHESNSKMVDGDGTVTLEALKSFNFCKRNTFKRSYKISEKLIVNKSHLQILFDTELIDEMVNYLRKINNKP